MDNQEMSAYFKVLGSMLYNEPSLQIINMSLDEGIFDELPFDSQSGLIKQGFGQMKEWLGSATAEELTDQARVDYMRLLVGVGKVLAPPWGSVYLDEDKLLFNEDTLRVRQFYERNGMMLKDKYKEPDDHIGLELEFVAYLLENDRVELAVEFIQKYMMPWVGQWNDDVQRHARTGYYRGLANMVAGGIQALTE